jgi:hypothetical protein
MREGGTPPSSLLSFTAVTLLMVALLASSAFARSTPRRLSQSQEDLVKTVSRVAFLSGEDPAIFVAIAGVETNFTADKISAGNYGLTQINWTAQARSLAAIGITRKEMLLDPLVNVAASIDTVRRFRRKYKVCNREASSIYPCYNRGQGWRTTPKRKAAATAYKRLAVLYERAARTKWSHLVYESLACEVKSDEVVYAHLEQR